MRKRDWNKNQLISPPFPHRGRVSGGGGARNGSLWIWESFVVRLVAAGVIIYCIGRRLARNDQKRRGGSVQNLLASCVAMRWLIISIVPAAAISFGAVGDLLHGCTMTLKRQVGFCWGSLLSFSFWLAAVQAHPSFLYSLFRLPWALYKRAMRIFFAPS